MYKYVACRIVETNDPEPKPSALGLVKRAVNVILVGIVSRKQKPANPWRPRRRFSDRASLRNHASVSSHMGRWVDIYA